MAVSQESVQVAAPPAGKKAGYRTMWTVLLLGWVVSYADRTLTGPVVSWMIANRVGFIGQAEHPLVVGGLVGSLFFTGYMLSQYPSGRLGDRFGHREMVVLSLASAAVLTVVSGFTTGLLFFVTARVLTGLGEGAFYSNDRTLIISHTPVPKRALGLGVVISGLSIGLTLGVIGTPLLIDLGTAMGLGDGAWRVPFWTFGVTTLLVAVAAQVVFRRHKGAPLRLGAPLLRLAAIAVPLLVVLVALFLVADAIGWPAWVTAVASGVLALLTVGFAATRRGQAGGELLKNRNLVFLYISTIPVLWNLWFFSFWSVEIVRETARSSLLAAALTAAFNAGAGILGYPLGGWLADRRVRRGQDRKPLLIGLTVVYSVLVFVFAITLSNGQRPSLMLIGSLLFVSGIMFNALQPVGQSITADLAPARLAGANFGMLNLVAELGAVASPAVSGALREATGSWSVPTWVAGGLMVTSAGFLLMVREQRPMLDARA